MANTPYELANFWASFTLSDTSYKDQALKPHMHMTGLETPTFSSWLDLFFETPYSLYCKELVTVFKTRSQIIATKFMRILGLQN